METDAVLERLHVLEAQNAELQQQITELRADRRETQRGTPGATGSTDRVSRRGLICSAATAVAVAAVATVHRTTDVAAHDNDDVRLGADNPQRSHRTLVVTSADSNAEAFVGLARNVGSGVVGQSLGGSGVVGYAGDGVPPAGRVAGVFGFGSGSAPGVYARSNLGNGVFGVSYGDVGVVGQGPNHGVVGVGGSGSGVHGISDGPGVTGRSTIGDGVQGRSDTGTGVAGVSVYLGTSGIALGPSGEHYGVYGESRSAESRGVFGRCVSPSGGTGAWGQVDGPDGVGVRGLAWNSSGGTGGYGTGVIGSAGSQKWPVPIANTGVYGVATGGRGGVFDGDKAQVRLVPSTTASHPDSGSAGDLFLDKSKRLWLCKGGTGWALLG